MDKIAVALKEPFLSGEPPASGEPVAEREASAGDRAMDALKLLLTGASEGLELASDKAEFLAEHLMKASHLRRFHAHPKEARSLEPPSPPSPLHFVVEARERAANAQFERLEREPIGSKP